MTTKSFQQQVFLLRNGFSRSFIECTRR